MSKLWKSLEMLIYNSFYVAGVLFPVLDSVGVGGVDNPIIFRMLSGEEAVGVVAPLRYRVVPSVSNNASCSPVVGSFGGVAFNPPVVVLSNNRDKKKSFTAVVAFVAHLVSAPKPSLPVTSPALKLLRCAAQKADTAPPVGW
jgi:hypothetical protein